MEKRRLNVIFGSLFMITVPGWGVVYGLNRQCTQLSQADCRFLWILLFFSILGAILLVETLLILQKDRAKREETTSLNRTTQLSSSQIWSRSIIRILLSTVMLSLPVIIQGAFAATGFGIIVGFGIDFLIRGIMGWLPLPKDAGNT
jgi:hypothetical protein